MNVLFGVSLLLECYRIPFVFGGFILDEYSFTSFMVSFEFPVETTWFRIFYLSEVLLSSICCK